MDEENSLKDHFQKHYWSRLVVVLLGFWLMAAPFTFGYEAPFTPSATGIGLKDPVAIAQANHHMMMSDLITGLLVVLFGLIALSWKRTWPAFALSFIGIWLQLAPLVFWAPLAVSYLNDTLVGMLLIAFSLLIPQLPYEGWSSDRTIPAGWSYNPSSWLQRLPVIFFGFLGWFISRYLSAYQLGYIGEVWDPFFGDGTLKVITSNLSRSFPISDAGLGAVAYGLEALMGCKGGEARWRTMPWMVVIFGLLVVPLGFVSIMLVMSQPIIVGSWCGLCLVTAAGMLIMLALTVDEVVAVCQFLCRRGSKPFWPLFFRGGEQEGAQIDNRTPSFIDSRGRFQAMITGVTAPWNLILTALLGIVILFSPAVLVETGPAQTSSTICGALIAVFSVIAWAEVMRSLRLINVLFALWLFLAPWFLEGFDHEALLANGVVAVALILLSLRKGPLKESYGRSS